jgi:hypothetical protein
MEFVDTNDTKTLAKDRVSQDIVVEWCARDDLGANKYCVCQLGIQFHKELSSYLPYVKLPTAIFLCNEA